MVYYLYILYSNRSDRYYIGQTNNLEDRLRRHNLGYVRSTKAHKPWELVYKETYQSRAESMARETYLKSLKSKKAIKELVEASR